MSFPTLLQWLRRRPTRRLAPAAQSTDLQNDRFVRLGLEQLEERLPPGNLLGMASMSPLSAPGSGASSVVGGVSDPFASPFGSSSGSSSQTGLGLSIVPPTGGPSSGGASTPGAPAPASPPSNPTPPAGLNTLQVNPPSGGAAAPDVKLGGGKTTTAPSAPPAPAAPVTAAPPAGGSSPTTAPAPAPSPPPVTTPTNPGYVQISSLEDSHGHALANANLTNDPQPIVVGHGAAGESVQIKIDGATSGTTTVASDSSWSYAIPAALTHGDHTVQAVSGGAGFFSQTASAVVSIDLIAPTVTLVAPDFAGYAPPVLQVQAVAGDSYGLGATAHIDVDLQHDGVFTDVGDQDYGVAALGADGTASFYLMTPLAYGTYSLRARVSDRAGNDGVSATATMIVDPNAGLVHSQPLLDLANGLKYGTPVPTPGANQPTMPAGPAGWTMPAPPPGATPPAQGGQPQAPPGINGFIPAGLNFLEFDGQGRVKVNVHSTLTHYLAALKTDLTTRFGFTATGTYASQNMVIGWLPVNQILNLPNAAHFHSVTPVYKPQTNVGSVTSEGSQTIQATSFRSAYADSGAGVKVGVISDSVNEFGGGLAQSVATGDLPANVQVLSDDATGAGTDEGRAMLEIVHDVAPGAALAFSTGDNNGPQGMADSINALQGAGSNVITDDLTYFDEPMFNDGVIAQAATGVVNNGVFYTTSANNNANHGYFAPWQGMTATVGGVTGAFQNVTGAGSPLQTFTLAVGGEALIGFQWDAAYLEGGSPGNGTGNFKVNNDMQVLVTKATGGVLATPQVFDAMATSTNEAFTLVDFINDGSFGTNNFAFSFNLVSGAAPGLIRWVSFDDGATQNDPQALLEGAPAVFGHAAAAGVATTGAVDWTTPTQIESFSALGGNMPILFDVAGNRLVTATLRAEPIIAAPDGVHTSFFGQPDGAGGFEFFGTSAATPHVAAAAALLLSQAPGTTPGAVVQYLQQNAIDLHTPAYAGAGLIQLRLSINGAFPVPPGPQAPLFADDIYERNDTSDVATQFGRLTAGTFAVDNLTVNYHADGRPDYDWFQWQAAQSGTLTATENTSQGGNLEVHLFTLQGNTLVAIGDSTAPGASHAVTAAIGAGQQVLVEVKGHNTLYGILDQAAYNLSVTLQ